MKHCGHQKKAELCPCPVVSVWALRHYHGLTRTPSSLVLSAHVSESLLCAGWVLENRGCSATALGKLTAWFSSQTQGHSVARKHWSLLLGPLGQGGSGGAAKLLLLSYAGQPQVKEREVVQL